MAESSVMNFAVRKKKKKLRVGCKKKIGSVGSPETQVFFFLASLQMMNAPTRCLTQCMSELCCKFQMSASNTVGVVEAQTRLQNVTDVRTRTKLCLSPLRGGGIKNLAQLTLLLQFLHCVFYCRVIVMSVLAGQCGSSFLLSTEWSSFR